MTASLRSTVRQHAVRTPAPDALARLLGGLRCLVFDFDGPICSVFAGRPATAVARNMLRWLDERGLGFYQEEDPSDPLEVLRDARRELHPRHVRELGEFLAQEEVTAVQDAAPTQGADDLIRALSAEGVVLAVASNNGWPAIDRYVDARGLGAHFGGRLFGRAVDPSLMKPNPDCVHRALRAARARPSEALMVGDSASDVLAAGEAGVPFLGFARDERHEVALVRAGAETVVRSWRPLVDEYQHAGR